MKTDIFEDMKDYIGCNDVSDLPYRKREVWEEIKRQLPLKYPKEQLEKLNPPEDLRTVIEKLGWKNRTHTA